MHLALVVRRCRAAVWALCQWTGRAPLTHCIEIVVVAVVPSTRVVSFKGKELSHGLQSFVAPSATVVGSVQLGELASVWYGASVIGTIVCNLFVM